MKQGKKEGAWFKERDRKTRQPRPEADREADRQSDRRTKRNSSSGRERKRK